MRKKLAKPLPLSAILPDSLKKWPLEEGVLLGSLNYKWSEIVGIPLSRKTRPLSFKKGRLKIGVENSPLANELQLLQSQILDKVRRDFPEVSEIRFQIL